jgi:hypothetical protein
MLGNYKLVNIKNGPITAVSADLYVFNISRASYLNIKNPENPINVIGSMYVPEDSFKEITDNLSKYNKELSDSYILKGTIVDISYREPLDRKSENYIKGQPVEILPDHNLDDKIEMITNKWNLYQLANNRGGLEIVVKISIF